MKTYTVFEVLADGPGAGPAADGTYISRFKREADAQRFAARSTCYGRPASVSRVDGVSKRLAQRWGVC